jgi:hypothetical protein
MGRKNATTTALSPEDLIKRFLSQYTEWHSKQSPETQTAMLKVISAQ